MGEVIPVDVESRPTIKRWLQLLPYALYEYFRTKWYIVRLWLAKYMARTGDERAIETLCDALEVREYVGVNPIAVRVYAAEALGRIRSERVARRLLDALDTEPNLIVKEVILESLANQRYHRAFETFIKYLNFYKRPERVCYMAHPLFVPGRRMTAAMEGQIGGSLSTRIMVGWGESSSRLIRKSAARGLGMIGDRRAVEPLVKRLRKDASVYVRRECVYALAAIGDSRAFPCVAELLDDPAVSIRRAAARVIPKLAEDPYEALQILKRRFDIEDNKLVARDIMNAIEHLNRVIENTERVIE